MITYFNWHTRAVETVREQHPLSQHAVVPSTEFNLWDRESMSQMQGTIHIWVWEVSKPLGVFFTNLSGRQAGQLLGRRCIDLEDLLVFPSRLTCFLYGLQKVSFPRLHKSWLECYQITLLLSNHLLQFYRTFSSQISHQSNTPRRKCKWSGDI